jgi:hypothetical protein
MFPSTIGTRPTSYGAAPVSHPAPDAQVETSVQTSPDGATVLPVDRVCTRRRVLTKS